MSHYDPYNSDQNRQFNVRGLIGGLLFGPPGGGFYPGYQPQPFPPYTGGPGQAPFPPQTQGPPTGPPPPFEPQKSAVQPFAVDPGAIRGCMFRFTYIWLNRDSFWFYPVFLGRNSVAGYRWRRNRWVYFGIDLDEINSFQCF